MPQAARAAVARRQQGGTVIDLFAGKTREFGSGVRGECGENG
jgi:hypothetical protein